MIYTKNQFKISFSVPGLNLDSKSWDKFSGGSRKANTGTRNPGGLEPSIAHGGVVKRNPVTLERAWDDVLIGQYQKIDASPNSPCSIRVTPLKGRGTTVGSGRTYTGVVSEVIPPDQDSESSDVAVLQVIIELNEPIA